LKLCGWPGCEAPAVFKDCRGRMCADHVCDDCRKAHEVINAPELADAGGGVEVNAPGGSPPVDHPDLDELERLLEEATTVSQVYGDVRTLIAEMKRLREKIQLINADWTLAFAAAVGMDSGLTAPLVPEALGECLRAAIEKAKRER